MTTLVEYLKSKKASLTNDLNSVSDIHLVIGNESCDLDSTVSCIALAYFLDQRRIPQIPRSALILPVLNVAYEDFLFRTENCFMLQECGIILDTLIYRNEIDIEKLVNTKRVTTSLVDHHVLSEKDSILKPTVVQIFDHRPYDVTCDWRNRENVSLRIEEVGSCATLIADEILCADINILKKDLAYPLYETIVYDTIMLIPDNGRAKKLDLIIGKILEDKFCFDESRKCIFDKLWAAHNNVVDLTVDQILLKDLKIVDNTPVPGLPVLVQEFLLLKDAYEAIKNMAREYGVLVIVLIGLSVAAVVKRDVAIYWRNEGEELKDILLAKLKDSERLKGYNFGFEEVPTEFSNIILLRQNNVVLSRKQMIPLIKDGILEFKMK